MIGRSAAGIYWTYKAGLNRLSSKICDEAESGGKLPCQVPDCDRSSRAADEVRDHAFASPWPVVRRLDERRVGAVRLTPARWSAKIDVGQAQRDIGPGGMVPDGTALEPRWNRQVSDIIAIWGRFQQFQPVASHDARIGACRGTRAYAHEGFAGTLEPHDYIYINELVSSSKAVPTWFQPGTAWLEVAGSLRDADLRNILGVGYACVASLASLSSAKRGRGGESFGIAIGGGADPRDLGNGGFLRVFEARDGLVGRVLLEGWSQEAESNGRSWPRHLPDRQRCGGWRGLDRRREGAMPPLPRVSPHRLVARQTGGIFIEVAPPNLQGECKPAGMAQTWDMRKGSGWGSPLAAQARTRRGLGMMALIGGRLRRTAHARSGCGDVN
jgi:hypothetical protein